MGFGWDETIRPVPQITSSWSPDNKRKRRFDDRKSSQVLSPVPSGVASPSHSHSFKRLRGHISTPVVPLKRRLEPLTNQQLVELIENLCAQQPELGPSISRLAPPSSPARCLAVLAEYADRVREAIPHGDPTSDYAYLRVQSLLQEFFTALADYTAAFMPPTESQASRSLEFLDGAANMLHTLPRWSTPVHNTLLYRAYGQLAESWAASLRHAAASSPLGMIPNCEAQLQRHDELSSGRMREAIEAANSLNGEAVLPAPTWIAGARAF